MIPVFKVRDNGLPLANHTDRNTNDRWWLSEFGQDEKEKAYFMSGTGGNKIVAIPKLELVVVLTSTYYNGGMESHNQTTKLMDEYIVPEIKKIKK